MKAAIYSDVGVVENVVRSIPKLKNGETLLRIESVGICGTDMTIFSGRHPRAKAPLIMGHEVGGVVVDIAGEKLAGVEVGSRVTFYPLLSCGVCYTCQTGNFYVCENLKLIGIDSDGGMAEYAVVPSESVIPVPRHWNKNWAALMEPVAVAVHAVRRSSIKAGDNVLILGAGIIGVLCGQMAKAAGAAKVIIADLIPFRLNIAGEVGLIPFNLKEDDLLARVREITNGRGVDITMECSGSAGAQPYTTAATRVLGEIVIVGMPKEPPPVDLRMVTFKELTMVGTRVYEKNDFVKAIELVEQERIDVDKMITHEFPIERVKEAFDLMAKSGDSLKILLTF
jgi:2-desacetyl-2-hydroxyethyl bacteriochlorophyllide A dehydrogenase